MPQAVIPRGAYNAMCVPSTCILLPHPLETFGQAKVRDLHVVPRRFSMFFSSFVSKTAWRRVRRRAPWTLKVVDGNRFQQKMALK